MNMLHVLCAGIAAYVFGMVLMTKPASLDQFLNGLWAYQWGQAMIAFAVGWVLGAVSDSAKNLNKP